VNKEWTLRSGHGRTKTLRKLHRGIALYQTTKRESEEVEAPKTRVRDHATSAHAKCPEMEMEIDDKYLEWKNMEMEH